MRKGLLQTYHVSFSKALRNTCGFLAGGNLVFLIISLHVVGRWSDPTVLATYGQGGMLVFVLFLFYHLLFFSSSSLTEAFPISTNSRGAFLRHFLAFLLSTHNMVFHDK